MHGRGLLTALTVRQTDRQTATDLWQCSTICRLCLLSIHLRLCAAQREDSLLSDMQPANPPGPILTESRATGGCIIILDERRRGL